jgi:hypothetical protein
LEAVTTQGDSASSDPLVDMVEQGAVDVNSNSCHFVSVFVEALLVGPCASLQNFELILEPMIPEVVAILAPGRASERASEFQHRQDRLKIRPLACVHANSTSSFLRLKPSQSFVAVLVV